MIKVINFWKEWVLALLVPPKRISNLIYFSKSTLVRGDALDAHELGQTVSQNRRGHIWNVTENEQVICQKHLNALAQVFPF